jgi:hypothetical protein
MAPRRPIDPHEIAPASARKVEATFSACRLLEGKWAVVQNTTWKDSDGWDGHVTRLVEDLNEATARTLAALLSTEEGRHQWVRAMFSADPALAEAA